MMKITREITKMMALGQVKTETHETTQICSGDVIFVTVVLLLFCFSFFCIAQLVSNHGPQ